MCYCAHLAMHRVAGVFQPGAEMHTQRLVAEAESVSGAALAKKFLHSVPVD